MNPPTDQSLVTVGTRRGRPPRPTVSMPVTTWITTDAYDRLARLAHQHDVSMSAMLRELIGLVCERRHFSYRVGPDVTE